jgi:dienelactone hydrolase
MKQLWFVCLLIVLPVIAAAQTPKPIDRTTFAVLTTIYEYDRDIPLEVKTVRREETPQYIREKIVFRSVRDGMVPGYLALPKSGAGPFPVVLLLHSLTGRKEDWWEEGNYTSGGNVTNALLSAGLAVAMLDVQYHGERVAYNGFEDPGPMVMVHDYSNRYREMMVQTVVDYRCLLDYLTTRKEIDSHLVGVLGYSLGGMMTFSLAAVDHRVKAAVACSAPPFQINPVRAAVAPQNFAPSLANIPFLMLTGSRDGTGIVERSTALFRMIDSKTKDLRFFDSGHQLPVEYVQVGVDWLTRYLKR